MSDTTERRMRFLAKETPNVPTNVYAGDVVEVLDERDAIIASLRAREQALVAALQTIANGNPGTPKWLTDIEMADIARAALAAAGEASAQPSVQRTECMECGADLVLSGAKDPSGDFYCAACGTRN